MEFTVHVRRPKALRAEWTIHSVTNCPLSRPHAESQTTIRWLCNGGLYVYDLHETPSCWLS